MAALWTLLITCSLLCVAPLCIYFFVYNKRFWRLLFKIPGPRAYPIIGTLLRGLLTPEKMFLEERQYAKKYFPIYKRWAFDKAIVSLLDPEDVEKVLTSSQYHRKATLYKVLINWLGTGLLTSSGTKWHTRRKILTPAFHFGILQEFINIFNKETVNLVNVLKENCSDDYIDVLKPVTEFTLNSIGETSMGVDMVSQFTANKTYKKAIYDIGELLLYKISRIWLQNPLLYYFSSIRKKEEEELKILHEYSRNLIKERQKTLNGSYSHKKQLAMLDILLRAKHDGADIDDEGIREEVDTFMFEGHDTTSMAICFALLLLAGEPKVQEEILHEIHEVIGEVPQTLPTYNDLQKMKYMERCIKESLRLFPSVPFIARIADEDIKTKSGYIIPKDCNIGIPIYDIHRNPHIYPNPEKFEPDRFLPQNISRRHPFAYIPFSAGLRNCIGQKYAILEIKAALCGIIREFVMQSVDTPQNIKIKSDLILRAISEVRIKFVPR